MQQNNTETGINFYKLLAGTAIFLGTYFTSVILQYILPTLIDAMNGTEWGFTTEIEGIIWFFVIMIWTIGYIAAPIYMYVSGLTEKEEGEEPTSKIIYVLVGIVWMIISIMLTYATRNWVTTFTNMFQEDFFILNVLFYIGLATVYIFNILIIPIYMIKNTQ